MLHDGTWNKVPDLSEEVDMLQGAHYQVEWRFCLDYMARRQVFVLNTTACWECNGAWIETLAQLSREVVAACWNGWLGCGLQRRHSARGCVASA